VSPDAFATLYAFNQTNIEALLSKQIKYLLDLHVPDLLSVYSNLISSFTTYWLKKYETVTTNISKKAGKGLTLTTKSGLFMRGKDVSKEQHKVAETTLVGPINYLYVLLTYGLTESSISKIIEDYTPKTGGLPYNMKRELVRILQETIYAPIWDVIDEVYKERV
jgi:hypothetical protein